MGYANILDDEAAPARTITVNRPVLLNAIDQATIEELSDAFAKIGVSPAVHCVIVTGAGEKAFAAGADIAFMAGIGPDEARELAAAGHRLAGLMEGLHAPVIAAVNGFALGGGLELALACDFIVASANAKLGVPEASVGVIPGFGATQRLARRVGGPRAKELLFTGDMMSADEAFRIGLVNAVVAQPDLLPHVRGIAAKIASRAPLAVAAAKRAVRKGLDLPMAQALLVEQELFSGLFATADQKEGMRAFLEKRPAKFQGR